MTSVQRVIKYLAIALAMLIVFSIASAAIGGIALVADLFSSEEIELEYTGSLLEGNINKTVTNIDIEVNSINVWVRQGDSFKFETDNESVESKITKEKLSITQEGTNFLDRDGNSTLIIYIPADISPEKLTLNSAAGNVLAENVTAQKIDIDMGAGELQLKNCTAAKSADIDSGVGKTDIQNCKLTNLDLDVGMGQLIMQAAVYGESEIDCGIGQADIIFKGKAENYKIKASKGLGTLTVDGNSIAGETTLGDGDNTVEINAGIGKVTVEFYKSSK